jgi:hypothetical protein
VAHPPSLLRNFGETPRKSAAPHHEVPSTRFIYAGRPKAGAELAMTRRAVAGCGPYDGLGGIRTRRVVQRRRIRTAGQRPVCRASIKSKKAEPLVRGCSCGGYRMAWAAHAPRTWDNELSLTFATMAAPNRSTKTASQTNSRQFRSITRLQCYGHIKCQGRFGSSSVASEPPNSVFADSIAALPS